MGLSTLTCTSPTSLALREKLSGCDSSQSCLYTLHGPRRWLDSQNWSGRLAQGATARGVALRGCGSGETLLEHVQELSAWLQSGSVSLIIPSSQLPSKC